MTLRVWILFSLPGFLIALLIGLIRTRGRVRMVRLILISTGCGLAAAGLIFGAISALFYYGTRTSIDDHSQVPLTVEQARAADCPIPLPDGATHVQFEFVSGGLIALEILVRFEAPVAICRAHAQIVFNHWDKENRRPFHQVTLTPITRLPPAEDGDMVGRAAWFDAEAIERGVTGQDGTVQCWVDQDRGVFYCKITD